MRFLIKRKGTQRKEENILDGGRSVNQRFNDVFLHHIAVCFGVVLLRVSSIVFILIGTPLLGHILQADGSCLASCQVDIVRCDNLEQQDEETGHRPPLCMY